MLEAGFSSAEIKAREPRFREAVSACPRNGDTIIGLPSGVRVRGVEYIKAWARQEAEVPDVAGPAVWPQVVRDVVFTGVSAEFAERYARHLRRIDSNTLAWSWGGMEVKGSADQIGNRATRDILRAHELERRQRAAGLLAEEQRRRPPTSGQCDYGRA